MLDGLQSLNWQLLQDIEVPAHHNGLLDQLMIFGAQDVILLLPVLLLLLWFGVALATRSVRAGQVTSVGEIARYRVRGLELALMALPAVLVAIIINLVVGALVNEPRPFVTHPTLMPLVSHAADSSFPSDHAAVAAAIVTMLVIYLVYLLRVPIQPAAKPTTGGRGTRATLLALAAVVAVLGVVGVLFISYARVYVGVHYPGDVVGGMLCGLISGLIAAWARRFVEPVLVQFIALAERLHLA